MHIPTLIPRDQALIPLYPSSSPSLNMLAFFYYSHFDSLGTADAVCVKPPNGCLERLLEKMSAIRHTALPTISTVSIFSYYLTFIL